MATRKKRNAMQELRNKINASKEEALSTITRLILKATRNSMPQTTYNDIYDAFLESFNTTYKLTKNGLLDLYKEVSDFEVTDLLELTYTKDGKTFEERLKYYWAEAKSNLSNKTWTPQYAQERLIHSYDRILETETRVIETKVKDKSTPAHASLIVIESGCDTCQGGEYPIGETIEFPPFHPNCQCTWWYEETDNIDDIEDLELEVED